MRGEIADLGATNEKEETPDWGISSLFFSRALRGGAPGRVCFLLSGVGLHVDELAACLTGGEHYYAVDEGEESVVLTHAYVETGVVLSATLTLDDVAGFAL